MIFPKLNSVWRHKKSGKSYKVLLVVNENTTRPEEYPISVVYQDVDLGCLWMRPIESWNKSMIEI